VGKRQGSRGQGARERIKNSFYYSSPPLCSQQELPLCLLPMPNS